MIATETNCTRTEGLWSYVERSGLNLMRGRRGVAFGSCCLIIMLMEMREGGLEQRSKGWIVHQEMDSLESTTIGLV